MASFCLVVDDCEDSCFILWKILKDHGYEVMTTSNPAYALKICSHRMPEFIFLDYNMPGINGIDFISSINKMYNGKRPKVIMCTGESKIEVIQEAMKKGVYGYIVKPFTPATLLRHLNTAINLNSFPSI